MIRVFQSVLLVVILFSLSNCQRKSNNIFYDGKYKNEIKKVREEMSNYLIINNIPGASLAISKEGKIIYSEGMGLASKDLQVPATRETKFRIGEISEIFTSLMYQMMVENGILHPDSSIQCYIPDYPLAGFKETHNKITLSQLVNHSSGIREPSDDEFIMTGANFTLQKSIDKFKNDPLQSLPGPRSARAAPQLAADRPARPAGGHRCRSPARHVDRGCGGGSWESQRQSRPGGRLRHGGSHRPGGQASFSLMRADLPERWRR